MASTAAIFAAIAIVIIILLGGALGLLYLYPKLTHIHLPSVVSNNNSSSSSSSSSPSSTASIAKSVTTCSGNCSPSQLVGTEISTALYSNLTTVSYSTLSSIGSGQGVASPTQVNGSSLTNSESHSGQRLFTYEQREARSLVHWGAILSILYG